VKPVPNLPPDTDPAAVAAFQWETAEAARRQSSAAAELGRVKNQLRQMRATLGETPRADLALYARLDTVGQAVAELELRLLGDPERQRLSEPDTLSIDGRLWAIRDGHWQTRQMPTATKGATSRSPRPGWMLWSAI
jgi:hypothetical protein